MQHCKEIIQDTNHLRTVLRANPQNMEEIKEISGSLRKKYRSRGKMSLKRITIELDAIEREIVDLRNSRENTTDAIEKKLTELDTCIESVQLLYELLKECERADLDFAQDEEDWMVSSLDTITADGSTADASATDRSATDLNRNDEKTINEKTVTYDEENPDQIPTVAKKLANKVEFEDRSAKRRSTTTVLMDVEMSLFKQQFEEKRFIRQLEQRGYTLASSGDIFNTRGQKYTINQRNARKNTTTTERKTIGNKIAGSLYHVVEISEVNEPQETDYSTDQNATDNDLTKQFLQELNMDEDDVAVLLLKRKLASVGIFFISTGELSSKSGNILTLEDLRKLKLLTEEELDLLSPMIVTAEKTDRSYSSIKSDESITDSQKVWFDNTEYLKETVGTPLALALAEICTKKPSDPIQYLGHWLYRYRYNREVNKQKKIEILELQELVNKQRQLSTVIMDNSVKNLIKPGDFSNF